MKRALPVALLLAVSLSLAGCAPESAVGTGADAVAESAGPAAEETGTVDAAAYYLAAICPANEANDANWAALESRVLEDVVATAILARDASQEAADMLRDAPVVWPADVIEDLSVVADSFEGDVAPFDEMSRAATIEEAAAVEFPDIMEGVKASLRIRGVLGLPKDTAEGC